MFENKNISTRKIWIARTIAIAADLVQIGIFPLFVEGISSPLDVALDVIVGIVLIALLGWHIAFLPAFIVEMLPFADLAPSWTLAVFIVTRGKNPTAPQNELTMAPK